MNKKDAFVVKTVVVDDNYGPEEIYRDIMKDSSGVVLLRGSNAFLDVLTANATFEDRNGMFNRDGNGCSVQICPVKYVMTDKSCQNLTECRHFAVSSLYLRWCPFVKDRRQIAKSCYNSKAFNKFLDHMEYFKTDYVVLLV